jgi:hypothetical protein
MWRRVDLVWTDVSKEFIVSIFRVEKSMSEEPAWLQPPAHAGSSLADFSTLNMEAIRSSETSVHTRSTWCHIPENGILHIRFAFCLESGDSIWLSKACKLLEDYTASHPRRHHSSIVNNIKYGIFIFCGFCMTWLLSRMKHTLGACGLRLRIAG